MHGVRNAARTNQLFVFKPNWTSTHREMLRNIFSEWVSLIKMILRLFMFHLRNFDSTRKETVMCRKFLPGLRIMSSCLNKMIQEPLSFHENKKSFLRDKLSATWIVSVLTELINVGSENNKYQTWLKIRQHVLKKHFKNKVYLPSTRSILSTRSHFLNWEV